jgi:hypothetical protein
LVASALVCFGTRSPRTPVQSKGGANHATRTTVFSGRERRSLANTPLL